MRMILPRLSARLTGLEAGMDEARAKQMHRNVRRVQGALEAAGSRAQVLEVESSTRTAEEAARSIGVDVGQIVKSLVFVADGDPVLLLVAGDRRVDPDRARRALGVNAVGRADADAVREATGFPIGGVAPVGHPRPIRTVLDESLGRFSVIWAAAGTPNAVFPTSLGELASLTGGVIAEVGQVQRPPTTQ
jgi:prolyl-tRNA editing enzyme YbaK/EbsC (Cys-tRNA(Pro) deacylase)